MRMAPILASIKDAFPKDHTSEFAREHPRAGAAFNRLIGRSRMRSYFAKAIGEQFPDEECRAVSASRTRDDAGHHQLNYIVPGNIPQGAADARLYWLLFWALQELDIRPSNE